MAFPSIQSVTETSFSSSTTSHNANLPATVASGDLLLALITFFNWGLTGTPSGWTQIASGASAPVGVAGIFARVSDGTEGGSTVDFATTNTATGAVQIYRIDSWEGTLGGGVEVSSLQTFGLDAAPDPPSLTPSGGADDYLWIAYAGYADDDGTVSSYPTSYSGGTNTLSGGGTNNSATVASAYRQLNASSEDPGAYTLSESERRTAATLAIYPSAGGASTLTIGHGSFAVSGQPLSLSENILTSHGLISLTGKAITILAQTTQQITAAVLNFTGQAITITVSGLAAITYGISRGKGMSYLKGVGFKKVGRENVSTSSNPEQTGEQ